MREITFYLDFVSPYAWLAFARLPDTLEGISCHVRYRPVLLSPDAGAGPDIPAEQVWTCRHAQWLGHVQGVPLQMPQPHPFHPLPLLQLALECSDDGCINRFTAGALLRHVWEGGGDALAPERMAALRGGLAAQLRTGAGAPERALALLHANTGAALAAGVFALPMLSVDGHMFQGLDGLPMLGAYLRGDAWFAAERGGAAASVEQG